MIVDLEKYNENEFLAKIKEPAIASSLVILSQSVVH